MSRIPSSVVISITLVTMTLIGSLSFLTYQHADISQLIGFLGFIPSTIATLFVMYRQDEQKQVLDKVEKNTNGALTTLIQKVGPINDDPQV